MTLASLRIAARVEQLAAAVAFVEQGADRFGLSAKQQFAVTLALEEAFVNVCHHAYPHGTGEVELACGGEGDLFVVAISDGGVPFDILSLPAPDLTTDIMERKIGGLGVHFIRTLADKVSYRREGQRNVLRMCFGRSPSAGGAL